MKAELFQIKNFAGGQNTKVQDLLIADNECVDIENFEFTAIGSLRKRKGRRQVNSTELAYTDGAATPHTCDKMWHLHKFYKSNAVEYNIVWGHFEGVNTDHHCTTFKMTDAGVFTQIPIVDLGAAATQYKLSDTNFISSTTIADKLIFCNGVDLPYWYDSSVATPGNFKRLGIIAPTVTPTLVSDYNGSMAANDYYAYKYTYYNSTNGIESVPSSPNTVIVLAPNNDGITITPTISTDSNVDKIRIYRNGSPGNLTPADALADTFYLLTTIDNVAATHYHDGAPDITDQVAYDININDNQPPPEDALYCLEFKNRAWFIGDDAAPHRLYFSKIGQPDYVPTNNYIDIGTGTIGLPKGLVNLNNELWVVFENGFVNVNVTGISSTWSVNAPIFGPGVFSDRSVQVIELTVPIGDSEGTGELIYANRNSIAYLSTGGQIWAFDGYRFHYIGEKIVNEIRDIPITTLQHCPAIYHPNNNQYKISFDDVVLGESLTDIPGGGSGGGIPYNNKTMVFDCSLRAWTRENRNFECADVYDGGNDNGALYVGAVANGWIYEYDYGGQDAAAGSVYPITSYWKSKPFALINQNVNKRFRKAYYDAFGSTIAQLTIILDRGLVTFTLLNSLSSTATEWNINLWALYAAPTYVGTYNGDLVQGGIYKYKYRFVKTNGEHTALSTASANMTAGATAATNGITIAIPAQVDSYTANYTYVEVFRTIASGSIYYSENTLVARTAAGVAFNYNSTEADADLTVEAPTEAAVLQWASELIAHFSGWLTNTMVGKLVQFYVYTTGNDTDFEFNTAALAWQPKTLH